MDLLKIKKQLKERIALGLNYGFQSLESSIGDDSQFANELLNLKGQFNDLNRVANQALLSYEQVEIGFNKIRISLLEIIDKLSAEDLAIDHEVPKPYNNELQARKQNFFQLLNIHFENLENFVFVITSSETGEQAHNGRAGVTMLYSEFFIYNYRNEENRAGGKEVDIVEFCVRFFAYKRPQLEVYMKTIMFLLSYILDEELEQDFFLGVFRSVLSSEELALIHYFALSDSLPGFREILVKADLLTPTLKDHLIKPGHLDFL